MKSTILKQILLTALLTGSAFAATAATRVGYVYVGPKTDGGYNYAQDQGRLYVQAHVPGTRTMMAENVPENENVEQVMERMIHSGATVIFATSYGYLDFALKLAQKYPNVVFMHCGGAKTAANLGTYFADMDQAMYLAGMAAGAATKTGKLGFVGAHPIPQVLRDINAFTRGARSVNPEATTHVVWTGSWSDPGKEAAATNSLIDGGVDVVGMHVDSPITVIQTAEKRGVYVVGYHADDEKFAPHGWLTGGYWNWGPMMASFVEAAEAHTWKSTQSNGDLRDGAVELSPFGPGVSAASKSRILQTEKAIEGGTFSVWQGPIVKQDGGDVVAAGATLLQAQLDSMDFLVRGVVGSTQ
ncbi:MAG TPA: BMP family ABC transporter substrate-binding protein [Steroidobacteraceae bacterium]|jgi:basic membrane lipoprotein Med (substrate-binding protein (PBP1-ABC) superfamily)|nr:BMP family ABC transporter substrate-binding protein [Steroidobacteraceae bacterium]